MGGGFYIAALAGYLTAQLPVFGFLAGTLFLLIGFLGLDMAIHALRGPLLRTRSDPQDSGGLSLGRVRHAPEPGQVAGTTQGLPFALRLAQP